MQYFLIHYTRRREAKTRISRDLDLMSGFENLDVILGDDNINSIERELANVFGNPERHCDTESNS